MIWPFENDTSAIVRKLAKKSLKSEKRRNLMVVIAVMLAALKKWVGIIVAEKMSSTVDMEGVSRYNKS